MMHASLVAVAREDSSAEPVKVGEMSQRLQKDESADHQFFVLKSMLDVALSMNR